MMRWLRSNHESMPSLFCHSLRQSTSLRLAYVLGFAVAFGSTASVTWAQTCPLSQVEPNTLPSLLVNAKTMRRTQPDVVSYTSKVDRDDDGAPNAYHRGNADASGDPGLDHICVGGSVLEYVDNRLYNRYGDGGSVGELGGIDPKSGASRSQMCKEDYIAIRDAGFPKCGPDHLCMIWYGIAAEPRACGYLSSFGEASDSRCGIPIRQLDSQKRPSNYYLTTTALRRPGAAGTSRVQADYVDAAKVPYVVLPGKMKLPLDTPWAVGDLAVVVWKGRSVYAVVGDTGPGKKLGEASRAALLALRGGKGVAPIDSKDPATTLIFPGTADRLQGHWPLSATDIEAEGKKLVEQAGGAAALSSCPGLSGLR
ncbi:glycoside hydrolase family 75 protein [Ralstonia solanacearum]|uniref:glycoside hydrolase family 75 protein n=1 Tax=Ralstonia solanacearum TaxID=305 RepID=UPI001E532066|nr:glycoside hydrolase family 75 protein [Ralstonia solanacearum]